MKLQMLKRALIAYVSNSAKAIWSAVAHPLTIVGKKNCDVADYRIYGNSKQGVGDLSRNVLDKDTVGFLRTMGSVKRTETGIALKPTTASTTTTTYTHLDLGLMSDYEGQTVKASMELSRISEEGYGNTWFVIYDSANNKRTVIGTHRTDGDKIFLEANIKEGYTDERLTVRLYVTEAVSDTYYNFNNLMVYTGEDDADYEPYNKYKVPITVRGKNLFSETIYPLNMGVWVNGGTGGGGSYDALYSETGFISCDSFLGKTITLSPTMGTNTGIAFYDADKAFLSGKKYASQKSCTVVVPENAVYMKFTVPVASKDVFQVEFGNVATEFEPYIEPQIVNIYLDEPLGTGQVIQMSKDNLPKLPQFKGTTVYEAQTEIPPSGMQVQYY